MQYQYTWLALFYAAGPLKCPLLDFQTSVTFSGDGGWHVIVNFTNVQG